MEWIRLIVFLLLLFGLIGMEGEVCAAEAEPRGIQAPSPRREALVEEENGDVLVTGATIFLSVITLGLVLATLKLERTTQKHVEHSRDLVAAVREMIEVERLPQVAMSLLKDEGDRENRGRGCLLSVQNIGQRPVKLIDVTVDLVKKNGQSTSLSIDSAGDEWLLPLSSRSVRHDVLSDMFRTPKADFIEVRCSFRDTSVESPREVGGKWEIDVGDQSIRPV